MNLIELENLVKGAPDDYLVKEVQQPTGKVPPFLALSEIQRRKDMRDRYMAQKNEGAKPTIAEQLVGGIGSVGGAEAPEGAPIPTPSATGVPSTVAPPVAAGAAPMPTPQGMPQGFAAGGQVGYAVGGDVVPLGSQTRGGQSYLEMLLRGEAPTPSVMGGRPSPMTNIFQPKATDAVAEAAYNSFATPPADETSFTPASGGIGDIPPPTISNLPITQPQLVPAPAPRPAGKSGPYPSSAEAELAAMLANKDMFKLPEAINYEEFIQAAGAEEAAIREEAKKQAIGAALVQLGAGLSVGDMAKGFTTAGAESRDILSQGRKEASAQKALAQEMKLRGMEGSRNQAIQQQDMEMRRAQGAAEFEAGLRKDREQREYQEKQLALSYAQAAASAANARESRELSERNYQLNIRKGIAEMTNDLIELRVGKPPIEAYNSWMSMPEGARSPVNPMAEYQKLVQQYEPQARADAMAVFSESTGSAAPMPTPVSPRSNLPAPNSKLAPKAQSEEDIRKLGQQGARYFTAPNNKVLPIPTPGATGGW